MQFFAKTFFLSMIFILFIAISPVHAFGITPVKMLVTADPATSQTVVVRINNSDKTNLTFKLSVLGTKQDEMGLPVFERGVDEAEAWIFPEESLVTLKPGETRAVNFIIRVPENASAGSHYVGLAVEPALKNTNQNAITSRLLSLLTLQVKGLVQESVIIEKWDVIKGSVGNKSWKFALGLQNNGTVEVPLKGTAAIKNWRGEEIFIEPVVLGNTLLAGSRRVLSPEISLKNNISLPGIYQAQIQVNYGRTNQAVSAIDYIWYFPIWSKVVLAAGGLCMAFLVFLLIKKLRKS
ncbi:MAG: hypothetical protein HYT15_04450 [Candidatus Magasanikbacteria bacterium]|nr:hypothetical protein [Candidatus Magasanikbacteria bacterium]